MNQVGMNLPQGDQRPQGRLLSRASFPQARGAEFLQENRSIALHRTTRVVLRKAQVEVAFAVRPGNPAGSRRKSMHQPAQLAEPTRAQNCEFVFVQSPGWHTFIIKESRIPT